MTRAESGIQIRTVWRTAAEHCELVWSQFAGCRVRLWVDNRLILEESLFDLEQAIDRAFDLRTEWPALVE
jgi:hypothetical protein